MTGFACPAARLLFEDFIGFLKPADFEVQHRERAMLLPADLYLTVPRLQIVLHRLAMSMALALGDEQFVRTLTNGFSCRIAKGDFGGMDVQLLIAATLPRGFFDLPLVIFLP